ncbi:MAG TPA: hypothetical protein VHY20_08580 [Pirellulales bacterium]|nr:hypothetical protein [Pirellulales bacterium]
MSGEHLDLTSEADSSRAQSRQAEARRFVGIKFACCDLYARIYINRAGSAYEGYCPGCSKPVRIRIAPGGTDSRFFIVS